MPSLRLRAAALTLALGAGPLAGCAALNPVGDVAPGAAGTWTPSSPRVAVATTRAARPAPAPAPAEEARASAVRPGPTVRVEAPVLLGEAAASSAVVADALRARGADWIGTPYRFGGESRSGIDCSAFTRQLFRETFGLELPRNTALQVNEGEPVGKNELAPGDLVFFRRGGTRHVGVYLGDGEFVHASTSNGVTISDLEEGYYQRYYWTARRVLPGASAAFADGVRRRPLPRAEREAARAAEAEEETTDLDDPDFEWPAFEADEEEPPPPLPVPPPSTRRGW